MYLLTGLLCLRNTNTIAPQNRLPQAILNMKISTAISLHLDIPCPEGGGKMLRDDNKNEPSRGPRCFIVKTWKTQDQGRIMEHWLAVGSGWWLVVVGGGRRFSGWQLAVGGG